MLSHSDVGITQIIDLATDKRAQSRHVAAGRTKVPLCR